MEIFFTKDIKWLEKWDEFVFLNDRGSHLIFSDWLQSYESYGFDFEIGICLDNGKIIGGFGAIIAKVFFFKFYILPHGPIFLDNFENNLSFLLKKIRLRAKEINCCYLQYSLPFSENNNIKSYTYDLNLKKEIGILEKKGSLFKYIYSSYGINWLNFDQAETSDELLKRFTVQTRRNINLAYRKKIEIAYPVTEEDCKIAYNLIEKNAKSGNYSVRAFKDFRKTILSLIDKKRAFLLTISVNNEIKGAAFVVNCGNYLSYISGGTNKDELGSNVGYAIHWELIKKSYDFGYKGYNISMGGSLGVQNFKSKFLAKSISFEDPHYYLILKPIYFKIYLFVEKYFKPYKSQISKILSFLMKRKK